MVRGNGYSQTRQQCPCAVPLHGLPVQTWMLVVGSCAVVASVVPCIRACLTSRRAARSGNCRIFLFYNLCFAGCELLAMEVQSREHYRLIALPWSFHFHYNIHLFHGAFEQLAYLPHVAHVGHS